MGIKPEYAKLKKNILSVDNEKSSQEILKYLLGKKYNITIVSDGESAIELVKNENFDLVLMDINLGKGMDGLETLSKLRELKGFSGIPVIALTAFAFEKDKKRFLAAGFNDYLPLPYNKEQLLEIIERNLEQA